MKTQLRIQFENYLTLERCSDRTIESYVQAIQKLAAHYHKRPETLTNQQVQDYLLYLIRERKLAWNSCNVAVSAINRFYRGFLKHNADFYLPPRPRQRRLPEVLSRKEVLALIEAGKDIRHKALLSMTYGSGLRVGELMNLTDKHIESHRMLVRVEQGKGRKDRYTLLSAKALEYLRHYWHAFQPQSYLFFGRFKDMPMSATTAQRIYYRAKKAAGITRGKGIHTLRHCFATHLLEQGINIYHIKEFLGHTSIQTTMVYFHVQPDRHLSIQSPLDIPDPQPYGGDDHEPTIL
ncbi:MAG: site-specific integrase [Pseudomonadota bacterium]|nr:site-specific integrase [Pseudomonadota bacterium]